MHKNKALDPQKKPQMIPPRPLVAAVGPRTELITKVNKLNHDPKYPSLSTHDPKLLSLRAILSLSLEALAKSSFTPASRSGSPLRHLILP